MSDKEYELSPSAKRVSSSTPIEPDTPTPERNTPQEGTPTPGIHNDAYTPPTEEPPEEISEGDTEGER